MYSLFVGIDVSKDSFSATGLDPKGHLCFSITAPMDSSGFSELMKAVSAHCPQLSSVIACMESSGCYHLNLFSFLSSKGLSLVIVNPLLISNFAKLSLRMTKTDRKDSLTIAQFLRLHKDSLSQLSLPQNLRDLRDIARERESLCNLIASTKNEIKRILQSLFPELEKLCNLFTHSMLHFLKTFPSPRLIKMANPEAIAKALQPPSRGRKLSISPEDIIQTAQSSVGSISLAKETILKGKISTLLHLMERLDEMTELLRSSCRSMMIEDLEIITSIDGIDTPTGAAFLAEISPISHLKSHKNLIALAGMDPTIYQSGKMEGKSRISKRGNKHLRRLIYLMTVNVIRVNTFFKAYFIKRRKEGLPFKKAVLATAHKLVRVIFAMLSHKSKFMIKENSL